MTLAWLDAIIVRKYVILLIIVHSQKIKLSFNNVFVDSWNLYKRHLTSIRLSTMHLLSGLI